MLIVFYHCSFIVRNNCEGVHNKYITFLILSSSHALEQLFIVMSLHILALDEYCCGLFWFTSPAFPAEMTRSLVCTLYCVIHLHGIHHHIRMWSIGFYSFWFLFLTVAPPDVQWDQEHSISDRILWFNEILVDNDLCWYVSLTDSESHIRDLLLMEVFW